MVGWAYPPVAVAVSERGQSHLRSALRSLALSEPPPRNANPGGGGSLTTPRGELGAMWRDGYRQGWRSAMCAVLGAPELPVVGGG